MRLYTYTYQGKTRVGAERDDALVPLPFADMLALIEQIYGTTADRRKWDGFMHRLPFLQEMSGGQKFRLDRTEMRRWLRNNHLPINDLFTG